MKDDKGLEIKTAYDGHEGVTDLSEGYELTPEEAKTFAEITTRVWLRKHRPGAAIGIVHMDSVPEPEEDRPVTLEEIFDEGNDDETKEEALKDSQRVALYQTLLVSLLKRPNVLAAKATANTMLSLLDPDFYEKVKAVEYDN